LKLKRTMPTIHRWVGIILVIQILVWSVSGLVMTLLPVEEVEGDIYLLTGQLRPINPEKIPELFTALQKHLVNADEIEVISIRSVGAIVMAEIQYVERKKELLDLATGKVLKLDQSIVSMIAAESLKGEPEILFVNLVDSAGRDFDGPFPVWKVIADNPVASHLYISPENGDILAHRTRLWRWHRYSYDLHTFNFTGASTINNPLLSIMAILMILLALSGIAMTAYIILRRSMRKEHN
jgi:Na+-transporting NADH:ubiquinone oxidoreductase subunit F